MALVRLPAAAQQRDAMLRCAPQNRVDRIVEGGLRGHPVVQGMAFGVELIFASEDARRAPSPGTCSECRTPLSRPAARRG